MDENSMAADESPVARDIAAWVRQGDESDEDERHRMLRGEVGDVTAFGRP